MNPDFFTIDPTSIETLRESLFEDSSLGLPDFLSILQSHHQYLKESIRVLLHEKSSAFDKQENLNRFLTILDMHATAEQSTLYRRLQSETAKSCRIEGFVGEEEHDVAAGLAACLKSTSYMREWTDEIEATARVLASQVGAHIAEEESRKFGLARQFISAEELDTLASEYMLLCRAYFEANWSNMNFDSTEPLPFHSALRP